MHENEPVGGTHFHMNVFARRLFLTQRQKATQKWPIKQPLISSNFSLHDALARHGALVNIVKFCTAFKIVMIFFPVFFYQQHDEHNTRGHHQHAAVFKHGQILEGPTRHMRHTETCRGACQECALPQASTVSGHVSSKMGAAGKENQKSEALMLVPARYG